MSRLTNPDRLRTNAKALYPAVLALVARMALHHPLLANKNHPHLPVPVDDLLANKSSALTDRQWRHSALPRLEIPAEYNCPPTFAGFCF